MSLRDRIAIIVLGWFGVYQSKPHLDEDGEPITYKRLKAQLDAIAGKTDKKEQSHVQ